MSSHDDDRQAVDELMAMARVYRNHGNPEKADELVALAQKIENRMQLHQPAPVVDLQQFKAAREDEKEA
jgi:hypothetical protein